MNRRTIFIMAVAGLGLGAATAFQAQSIGMGAPKRAGIVVASSDAASESRSHRVAAEGRVVAYPGAEVAVTPERTGRVLRVTVEEGARVEKGDLLVELESDTLRASLAQAEARIAQSEAEIRLAELDQARRRELANQQIIATKDLDQANRDLEVARAQREAARAEANRLSAELRQTRIVAPISGTVLSRRVDPGEVIDTSKSVLSIADLARLRVSGEADEADASALVVGAPVSVSADGYPGRSWKGVIEDVAHSVTLRAMKPEDPSRPTDTRVIAVKVAFAEPSPLRLGATVNLAIESERSDLQPR